MPPRPFRPLALAALAAVSALSLPRPLYAQSPTDKAGAEALLSEGLKRVDAQDYAGACLKFEESLKLYASVNTEYHLADCYEHVGKMASAWVDFLEVAEKAQAAGETAKATKARERSSLIEGKVSRLTLVVANPTTAGLKITRDGTDVGQAQWGIPMPSDPGEHTFTVSAPGKSSVTLAVTVANDGSQGSLAVPKLEDAPTLPGRPAVALPAAPPEAPAAGAAVTGRGQRVAAWVVGGAGLAAMATGVAVALAAKSSYDGASGCTGSVCQTQSGLDTRNSARSTGNVATAVFVVGGAAVVGGGVLWLTAPRARSADPAFRVGVTPGALMVQGTF